MRTTSCCSTFVFPLGSVAENSGGHKWRHKWAAFLSSPFHYQCSWFGFDHTTTTPTYHLSSLLSHGHTRVSSHFRSSSSSIPVCPSVSVSVTVLCAPANDRDLLSGLSARQLRPRSGTSYWHFAVYTTPELVVACILPEPTVHAVPALVKSASLQKQQQCAQHVRQWSSTLQLRLDQRSQCFQQLRHGCVRDSRVGRKCSASPSGGLHLTRQPPPHRQW